MSPSISADGRFVAFQSLASNLVPGDTNNVADIFVRDRVSHTTRARLWHAGQRGQQCPGDQRRRQRRCVCLRGHQSGPGDTNGQLDIFVCNRGTGVIERVSVASNGTQGDGDSILPAINADGTRGRLQVAGG